MPRSTKTSGWLGLDIDGRFLAAVLVSPDGRVERAVSEPLREGIVRDGDVLEPEELSSALASFFDRHGLPPKVWLGLASPQVAVRQLELPRIDDDGQLETAVRFGAAEAIAMNLEEAVLDYLVLGETTTREGAPRTRVLVVAARRATVDALVDCARLAGLKPQGVELDAFALVRALADPDAPADEACVYCHVGEMANVAIGVGQDCLFTRPVPLGGAGGELAADAIAAGIRISTDFYGSQPDVRPLGRVMLAGPGADDPELRDALDERLSLAIEVAPATGHLPGEASDSRLTVAAGLALGGAL